jgi:hypothetical protein
MLAVVHPDEGRGKAMEPPHVHVYDADGELKKTHLMELWHASRPTE